MSVSQYPIVQFCVCLSPVAEVDDNGTVFCGNCTGVIRDE